MRVVGRFRGFVQSRALPDGELAALVERQRAYFAARGEAVEWRSYAHDGSALPLALESAGFAAEHTGVVLAGRVDELAALPVAAAGSRIVPDADLDAVAAIVQSVWGGDWSWLPGELAARRATAPDDFAVFAALADDEPVSAAWVAVYPGTGFAVLTGGTTLPAWRGRGCYRALVAARARFARARCARYLIVDASPDSAPILRSLGFVRLTEVTSYVWTPAT